MIEPGPRVLVLSRPAPDGTVPDRADLVLVPPGSGPTGTAAVIDLVGPQALAALAGRSDGPLPDLLVRPGPGPAASALEFLRAAVAAANAAGRPSSSVVLDAGLDTAPDEVDALLRLQATAELVALGHPVAVALDGPVGSAEAVATSAIWAGARLLRVAHDGVGPARRTADLTAALLAERTGVAT